MARDALIVACVLNVNDHCPYTVDYVLKLENMVWRHLKQTYRFLCLSNVNVPVERIPLCYGWPGWFAKLELFRPDIEAERILYLDLDTVIVGDLTDIANAERFTMIRGFKRNPDGKRKGSGLMMLTERKKVWEAWMRNRKFGPGGDQDVIAPFAEQVWQDVTPNQVVSYKHDAKEGIPEGARVICFHGKPRPHQLPENHFLREHWR